MMTAISQWSLLSLSRLLTLVIYSFLFKLAIQLSYFRKGRNLLINSGIKDKYQQVQWTEQNWISLRKLKMSDSTNCIRILQGKKKKMKPRSHQKQDFLKPHSKYLVKCIFWQLRVFHLLTIHSKVKAHMHLSISAPWRGVFKTGTSLISSPDSSDSPGKDGDLGFASRPHPLYAASLKPIE